MATTTNYGWETPDDTDFVKDGASAIRTLGSSVDTTTKALNPSTTLGDIEYRSATANTNSRLGIGTSGQVLSVNGSGVPAWTTLSTSAALRGCRLEASADLTLTNATWTTLTWNTEAYDTDAFHSTSTNTDRITIPTGLSGYYRFDLSLPFYAATSTKEIRIKKNGTQIYYDAYGENFDNIPWLSSFTGNYSAGDYFSAEYKINTASYKYILFGQATGAGYFTATYLGS
jgi:hypothetical protein